MADGDMISERNVDPEKWSSMLQAATTKKGESDGHHYLVLSKKGPQFVGEASEERLKRSSDLFKMPLMKIAHVSERILKVSDTKKAEEIKASLEVIAKSSSEKLHSAVYKGIRCFFACITLGLSLLYTNKLVARKEAEIQALRNASKPPLDSFVETMRGFRLNDGNVRERSEFLSRELTSETRSENIDETGALEIFKKDNKRPGLAIKLVNKKTGEKIDIPGIGPNESGEEHVAKIIEALNRFAPGELNKRMRELMQASLTRNISGTLANKDLKFHANQFRSEFSGGPIEKMIPCLEDKGAAIQLEIESDEDGKVTAASVTASVDYDIGVKSEVPNALSMPTGYEIRGVATYTLTEKNPGDPNSEPLAENLTLNLEMKDKAPLDPQLVAKYQEHIHQLQQGLQDNQKVEAFKAQFLSAVKPGLREAMKNGAEDKGNNIQDTVPRQFLLDVIRSGNDVSITILDGGARNTFLFPASKGGENLLEDYTTFFADQFPEQKDRGLVLLLQALLTQASDPAGEIIGALAPEEVLEQKDSSGRTHYLRPDTTGNVGKNIALEVNPYDATPTVNVQINAQVQLMDCIDGAPDKVSVGTVLSQATFDVKPEFDDQGKLVGDLKIVSPKPKRNAQGEPVEDPAKDSCEFSLSAVSHLVSA